MLKSEKCLKTRNWQLQKMKQIIDWLGTKFSLNSTTIVADQWRPPVQVIVERTEKAEEECTVESSCGGTHPDHAENNWQGNDTSTPDSYACDDTVANRQLSFLNEPVLDARESAEFDPYNTGRFDTSKAWDSGSLK
jgi:hypothetical protein